LTDDLLDPAGNGIDRAVAIRSFVAEVRVGIAHRREAKPEHQGPQTLKVSR
jgi:hypothetical protein